MRSLGSQKLDLQALPRGRFGKLMDLQWDFWRWGSGFDLSLGMGIFRQTGCDQRQTFNSSHCDLSTSGKPHVRKFCPLGLSLAYCTDILAGRF